MKSYLVAAIQSLKPGSEFVLSDDDYSTIEWIILDGAAPTPQAIEQEIEAIKAREADEQIAAEVTRSAILEKLGVSADELRIALG